MKVSYGLEQEVAQQMSHLNKWNLHKRLILNTFAIVVLSGIGAITPLFFVNTEVALAQIKDASQKQVTRVKFHNEPLEIVGLGNSRNNFKLNEKFEQKDEWLRSFFIQFKNDSGKNITFLLWQLDFPETESTGPLMVYPFYYGVHPIRKPKEYENEPVIKIGETFEQRFDQKKFENMKAFIGKRYSLDFLTQANIRIIEIRYDDGTGWNSGSATKEDPANPGRFVPVGN